MSTLSNSLISVSLKSAYSVPSNYLQTELAAIPLYFSCESIPKISLAALKAFGQTAWGGSVLEACCAENFCSPFVREVLVEERLKPENFDPFIQYAKQARVGKSHLRADFTNMIEEAIKKPLVFDFVFKHAASGIVHSDSNHREACSFLLKKLLSRDPKNSQFPPFFEKNGNSNAQMKELKKVWEKNLKPFEPIKPTQVADSTFLQGVGDVAKYALRYMECLYYYKDATLFEYLFLRPDYCNDYYL